MSLTRKKLHLTPSQIGRRDQQKLPQEIKRYEQRAHEKILHCIDHERDADQNNKAISPHTTENGPHQEEEQQQNNNESVWIQGERDSFSLLVEL